MEIKAGKQWQWGQQIPAGNPLREQRSKYKNVDGVKEAEQVDERTQSAFLSEL